MFSYFSYWPWLIFSGQGGHGRLVSLNMPLGKGIKKKGVPIFCRVSSAEYYDCEVPSSEPSIYVLNHESQRLLLSVRSDWMRCFFTANNRIKNYACVKSHAIIRIEIRIEIRMEINATHRGVTTIGHGWTKSRGPPSAEGPPSSRHIL